MKGKHKYLIVLLWALCLNSYGQKDSIDYAFLRQAISQLPACEGKSFILFDHAHSGWLLDDKNEEGLNRWLKELKYVIDSNCLKDIIKNSVSQKLIPEKGESLNVNKLNGIKDVLLLNQHDIDSIDRIKKSPRRGFGALCSDNIFSCSLPVFDSKKEYAVIAWGYGASFRWLSGSFYLFHLLNGKWKLEGHFYHYEY